MIQIIDFGSTKTPAIAVMVDEFMECEVIHYSELSQIQPDTKGVILSGAPILITEIDMKPFLNQFEWVKSSPIPVLGICFGHQLIGMLYGAFPARQTEDRDIQTIEFLTDHPLMDGLSNEIEMIEDHCENISIPKGFIHFGTSDACVNEAMYHYQLPLYGVQFHPEVSGNVGSTFIKNFIKICENSN
jgi:GMP synthase (glutamine-hydrolysing)